MYDATKRELESLRKQVKEAEEESKAAKSMVSVGHFIKRELCYMSFGPYTVCSHCLTSPLTVARSGAEEQRAVSLGSGVDSHKLKASGGDWSSEVES